PQLGGQPRHRELDQGGPSRVREQQPHRERRTDEHGHPENDEDHAGLAFRFVTTGARNGSSASWADASPVGVSAYSRRAGRPTCALSTGSSQLRSQPSPSSRCSTGYIVPLLSEVRCISSSPYRGSAGSSRNAWSTRSVCRDIRICRKST